MKLWTCDEIVLILITLTGRLHSTEPVIWARQRPRFHFLLHRNVKRTWRYQTCALCYSSFEQALWLLGKFNGDFQCEMLRNFHRSVSSLLTIRSSLLTRPKDSRVLYFWNSPVKLNSSDNKVTKIKFSECSVYVTWLLLHFQPLNSQDLIFDSFFLLLNISL